jgi:hypothetical protein
VLGLSTCMEGVGQIHPGNDMSRHPSNKAAAKSFPGMAAAPPPVPQRCSLRHRIFLTRFRRAIKYYFRQGNILHFLVSSCFSVVKKTYLDICVIFTSLTICSIPFHQLSNWALDQGSKEMMEAGWKDS